MKQRFYSKKDKGMMVFIVFLILFLLFGFSTLFFGKTTPPAPVAVKILVSVITLGTSILLGSLLLNTWYEIDNEYLVCRSGPICKKVPISTIRSLSKPRKMLFKQSYLSLGLSFTQTTMSYNKYDDISISPEDFDGLVAALKLRNPKIEVV